jgi:hypothetical protein
VSGGLAGAHDAGGRACAFGVLVCVLLAACGGESAAPVPVRTVVHRAGGLRDADWTNCLRRFSPTLRPPGRTQVVERSSVEGESLTFRLGPLVHGCDRSRARPGSWCGSVVGRVRRGRLTDPRVDLAACQGRDGELLAFAWLMPERGARALVVAGDPPEAYPAAAGLPIRVISREVGRDASSAVFRVEERSADGRVLSRRRLELRVAG